MGQRRHEHLHFHRVLGIGDELDFGVDIPQIIGFVFADGYAERQDLIGRDRDAEGHQGSDQDLQMECKRAHGFTLRFERRKRSRASLPHI